MSERESKTFSELSKAIQSFVDADYKCSGINISDLPIRRFKMLETPKISKAQYLVRKIIESEIERLIPSATKMEFIPRYDYFVNEKLKISISLSYFDEEPMVKMFVRKIFFDDDGNVDSVKKINISDDFDELPEEFKEFYLFNPHLV
jgi:hypothetical protein